MRVRLREARTSTGRAVRASSFHGHRDGLRVAVDSHRLSSADYPLTFDFDVSPAYSTATEVYGPSYGDEETPDVAWNGSHYLVVWTEWSTGFSGDVFGTRVTPDGEVLDPDGIPICLDEDDQEYQVVESNGDEFLVAWQDWTDDPVIAGRRVSASGVVLDEAPILISAGSNDAWSPAITSDGTNFLVVWDDYRVGDDVYGARVAPDGTVLDAQGIPISTGSESKWAPKASWSGNHYLVAWQARAGSADWNVTAARMSADGQVLDPAGIAISTAADDQREPAVASNGETFLVAWQDERFETRRIRSSALGSATTGPSSTPRVSRSRTGRTTRAPKSRPTGPITS